LYKSSASHTVRLYAAAYSADAGKQVFFTADEVPFTLHQVLEGMEISPEKLKINMYDHNNNNNNNIHTSVIPFPSRDRNFRGVGSTLFTSRLRSRDIEISGRACVQKTGGHPGSRHLTHFRGYGRRQQRNRSREPTGRVAP